MSKEDYMRGPGKGAFKGLEDVNIDLGAAYQKPAADQKPDVTGNKSVRPPAGLSEAEWNEIRSQSAPPEV